MKTTGEVSAIVGYNKQYEVCAIEIYDELLNNNLEWVEFASPNVGKLDDVLIGCKDYVKAFQIKDIDSNFTYSKFSRSSNDDGESILEGCFKGWQKLKKEYNKEIIAKYISNEKPSNHDKINSFSGETKPSFSRFQINFWNYLKDNEINNIDKSWLSVFEELKNICNTSDSELIQFIKSFEFVLSNEYNVQEQIYDYNGFQRGKDINKISKGIFKIIGTNGTTKLNKKQILEQFNLLERYETYFQHSFFVDEKHYQPVIETIQKLEIIINEKNNGYIALIGNAGSGKSTLLTKWIKEKGERVLKYYAYVNKEMNYDYGYRGEAKIFLKDLLIQIRENEFSQQKELPADNIEELQKQLSIELRRLENDDTKTYIIVDGLDHIEREQSVNRSLLEILPNPEQIPKNVYFILGSRTVENLDNLPEKIKIYLKNTNSTVTISPLTITQTQNLIESYQIPLNNTQVVELQKNTSGHPLFLRYTIEELLKISEEDYDAFISQKKFSGDIFQEYEIFWLKNKLEDSFIDLLGIISRFRYSYIDINLLHNFPHDRATLHKIKKLSEHYFFKIGNIWQFFHNSFKEFLREKTAEDFLSEQYDESKDLDYHKRIYEVIKNINSDYKWNTLYHLYHAREYDELIKNANQSFFREQWFHFRNYKNILEDIKISAKASYFANNTIALMDYFISYFEINQRNNHFHLGSYYKTFLLLGKTDISNSFIFNNFELLVSNSAVLDYGVELYKLGDIEQSKDLLRRAEPSFILNISKEASPNRYNSDEMSDTDEINLITKWAKLSSLYNPIQEILDTVKEINIIKDEFEREEKRDLVFETIQELTDLYFELENWNKLSELYDSVIKIPDFDLFFLYFEIVLSIDQNNNLYKLSVEKLNSWEETKDNRKNRRLALFEVLINKNVDKGETYFNKMKSPLEINQPNIHYDEEMENYLSYIYDYSMLYYTTQKDFTFETNKFIPKTEKKIFSAFYNEFAELGKSYAYFYHNNPEASKSFIFRINQILNYFHNQVTDFQYEHSIHGNKVHLINLIIRNCSKISEDFLPHVLKALSIEWQVNSKFWINEDKQRIVDYVLELKTNNHWCENELNLINEELFEYGDNYSKIENGIRQIELWSKLEEATFRGNEILSKLMEISLNIKYDDDHQLDYLIDWYFKNSEIDFKQMEFFIQCLDSIKYSTSHSNEYPAEGILKYILPHGNGFEYFKFLLFEGQVNFCKGLEILLCYLLESLPKYKYLLIKIFSRILLNFDNSYSGRLNFINKLFENEVDNTLINDLIHDVNIYSVYEHRNNYLFDIQRNSIEHNINLKTIGLSDEIKVRNNNSSTDYEILKLKDGSVLKKEYVIEQSKDLQNLIDLLDNESYGSYFKWAGVIGEVVEDLTEHEVKVLLDKKDFKSSELVEIADHIYKSSKNKNFAIDLTKKALEKSSISGWHPFYDGGSKINSFRLLNEIGDDSYNDAFKDLAESCEAVSFTLSNLDDIFRVIDNKFSYDKYYPVIKEYTDELLKSHYRESKIPDITGDKTSEEYLIGLICFLIQFPSHFDEILIEILAEELDNCESIVREILVLLKSENLDWQYINLLAVVSLKNEKFGKGYEKELCEFLNHSRFDIHILAIRILKRLEIDYYSFYAPSTKTLPFIYTMELSYKPELVISSQERMKRLDETGYLRETNDPLEFCHLYKNEIRRISEETDLSEINIAHRIMQLGKSNYNTPNWYKNLSEKEIRDLYEYKFDLRISYRRPQNQKVWCGLMMVLKELWELDLIERGFAYYVSNVYDENLSIINPEKKPKFILPIVRNDNYVPSADEKWVYELNEEYINEALKIKISENVFVIAEHTFIEGQGDGITQEIRQAFLDFQKFEDNIKYDLIFNSSTKEMVSDYLLIDVDFLCFYNWDLNFNKKRNWIAFNPAIAIKMGLYLSNEGSFRWLDEEDNIVIESIFWKNNDETNRSRNLHSESGHGWYVTITKDGLDRLKKIGINHLFHHKKIYRKMRFVQRNYGTNINEENEISLIRKVDT